MLDNAVESDITFRVGEDEEAVHAHKLFLASRSPVFMAMFHGALKEVQSDIKIPDSDPESFTTFLRYIYTDEAKPTVHNCMSLLYLAKKYQINNLVQDINKFLIANLAKIEPCDVVGILNGIICLDGSQHIITECTLKLDHLIMNKLVKKGELNQLSRAALMQFTKSQLISSQEEAIFDTCLQWARNKCLEENLPQNGINLRKVFGEILFEIRFPLFSLLSFTKHVSGLGTLNAQECNELFRFITLKHEKSEMETVREIEQNMAFKATKRRYIKVVLITEISRLRYTTEVGLDNGVSDLILVAEKHFGSRVQYMKYRNKTLQPGVRLMDYGVNNGETITLRCLAKSEKY